jgi:hypothetical protein
VAKSSQPKSKSPVEVAAELREEREKRATQARSDLIAHFGGDADPAATTQALAGEILRVRHAMSQIVEPGCRSCARPSNVAADGVRVRIVKER